MQNENQDEYFSDDDKDEKDEKDDKDDREVRQKNKSKKTVEKLFDVIFNTLESFRTYTGENGIPIAEEISYHDLYRFLTKS